MIRLANQYVYKNYSFNFYKNVTYKIHSKDIVECYRKDGGFFYLKIDKKNNIILHSGCYFKNKGVNKIKDLI